MRVHVLQLGRPRARHVGIVTIIVVAFVLALARPAWAHNVEVSGTTSCPDENHLVSWTIHNVETAADRPMIIVAASAEIGGTTYPVEGYDEGVPPDGETVGTTVVPGDVTGTITITVDARWPDDFRGRATGSVELQEPCVETTTTTPSTQPTTTTQAPPVTGGTAPSSAAPPPPPPGEQGGPGVEGGVAGVETGAGSLPRTGASSANWTIVGLAALAFGGTLLMVSRRGRFARR